MNQAQTPLPSPRLPLRFFWLWVILIISLFFLVKPTFRAVKSWRASIYLNRAKKTFASGNSVLAQEQCRLSLALQPGSDDAIRLLAEIAGSRGDPSALGLWMNLLESGRVTDQDRTALAETALRQGALTFVEEQLDVLLSRSEPSKETYNLKGLLSIRQNLPTVAREWFRKALERDDQYTRARINIARVDLFFSRDQRDHPSALQTLQNLGRETNEWGLESLRALVEWGTQYPREFPYQTEWADRLTDHPLSKIQDRCAVADWEIQTSSESFQSLVDEMTLNVSKRDSEEKRQIAAWLNRYQLFDRTLKTFPVEPNTPDDLFLVQLDALAALGKWKEISDVLSSDARLEKQPILRALFRGRAARELGNTPLFQFQWQKALEESGKNSAGLLYLAQYAEKLQEFEIAAEAYEKLHLLHANQLDPLLRLVKLYEHLGKTASLQKIMLRLLTLRPDDVAILNDVAYLSLLLDDSSTHPKEKARQAYERNPSLVPVVTTYALAQLKSNLPEAALKTIQKIPSQDLTAPGWQAVKAAILESNGKSQEATKIAKSIGQSLLKPEEKLLIQSILDGHQKSP
jgi:tetratricopeptide (TPR) repeat protein